jgi:metallophosphoesterase superfamily enzyme
MPPATTKLLDVEIRPGWRLSAERSLYFEEERTLAVADIHWGYAHAHRRAGNLLPLWGNDEIARRLRRLLDHYRPARMIWLGDSLHTCAAAPFAEDFLSGLAPDLEVVILAGNHDRKWSRADRHEYGMGGCVFHHGDRVLATTTDRVEIIGHLHPAISWYDGAGLSLKVPALVEGPLRLVLPSFSDWSAGATWNGRLAEGERLWLISARKIWAAEGEPRCP